MLINQIVCATRRGSMFAFNGADSGCGMETVGVVYFMWRNTGRDEERAQRCGIENSYTAAASR